MSECNKCCWTDRPCDCECHTAARQAAEIERLRLTCEALAKTLEAVADAGRGGNYPTFAQQADEWAQMLRAALAGEKW